MLTATITGQITSAVQHDEKGRRYCTIYSEQARRSVRAVIRNDIHAELVAELPKGALLSVSGVLHSRGAIGPKGQTLAFLHIVVQTLKIHRRSDHD